MSRKTISLLIAFFMLTTIFSNMASSATAATDIPSKAGNGQYEIYPLPQKQTYYGTNFTISDEVNLVIESAIDESATNFITSLLAAKSIQVTKSESVVQGKTNFLIGVKNSNEYVSAFFNQNIEYDAEIFNKNDAYVLDIDKKSSPMGNISILGANTDAAYYAIATLKMIFDQIPEKSIQSVKYEDYSDAKWRGFIEGFYGFPWSHEDRISLMRFGGRVKMNSYIFAPKDDKYHNSAWRTLYPADELIQIKELVDVGHESKTQFIWAIHPGFNMINWNNYDAELQTLLAKLDQLYSVGVRQFGLFMDDISTSQSLTDKDKHVKLITDVANWVTTKGDVKSLIYCPPFYNQSWTGEAGKPYLQALRNVPANVEIMWTGKSVVGSVNTTDMQWPKDATGRDPYMWLNWPVNDYKDSRLMLGKGEILAPGTHNFSGIVSNPMGSAELSKIALFAVADYTWNVDDFNSDESWLNSFDYVAPEVASELNTIAYHLSDPSPSGHGLQVGESENVKAELELLLSRFANGQSVEEVGQTLIAKLDQVLQAIVSFREKSQNANMVEEIDPWLNSLRYVVESSKFAAQSAIALQKGEIGSAWETLAKATNAMSESKKFKIEKLKYPDVTVEAGAKRLVPFAEQMINKLDAQIYTSIDPEFVIQLPMSSYGSPSGLNQMVDGDNSTNIYFQTLQKNGDWYGIDFGKTIKVHDIAITQGRTDTDHDIFQRGILEYSNDKQAWTAIGEERSGIKIVANELDLEARFVRYRLTHAGIPGGKPDLWTAVREFSVNADKGKAAIYTNVEELKKIVVNASEASVALNQVNQITLEPSHYVGIKLPAIEKVSNLSLETTSTEAVLESSENGVEWNTVTVGGPYRNAAYLRLINKGTERISFDLSQLTMSLYRFSEPVVTHNYESIYQGKLQDIYNGKLESKVWFGGEQRLGKYVQVDLGGIINVQNAAVVIGDGEGDYFRKGDLQLSIDGQTWETIHNFNNPGDRSLNFPEHEVPYRFKRVQVDGKQARYVRLISTVNDSSWLALNEIIVNEGLANAGSENPSIQANPEGRLGNESNYAIDHKLSSFYAPAKETESGVLNYKLSRETELSKVIIMQSPLGISNAVVSVRDMKGWHQAGILSKSYNMIDTSKYANVLEVKLEWDGAVKPMVHEIIPVKREGGVIVPEMPQTELTGAVSVAGGQQFDVQLSLKSVTESVYALDITLDYDPNTLEFVSSKSLKDGITLLDSAKQTPGHIRMLMVSEGSSNAITGDVQLLELKFKAKTVAETTQGSITVSQLIMGDDQGMETEAASSNFHIQVTAAPPGIPGDVNHDGKVSIGDLALVAAHYGKDSSSSDWEQVKHADLTNDGIININDLAIAARKILE
ncbi:beta-N-acetylglucosaminidase domain-containing protein [Paenibacillus sp. LHD-38]|uniref:beta-N-acetylglucosaminidase domain-containing protein n=1 Tax=Paenibacillus sp. LHD-38 TaxID=3072143 RepID=UPI00281058A7|nr:beta-N-acetylglucosaminidase domain-containing protein [Paenibacillus sp. LHD-38]MDQ8735162.1 beta-N-acetylglucosaminidase domain-containing protein [Paenibacillus sp. LHD-38]